RTQTEAPPPSPNQPIIFSLNATNARFTYAAHSRPMNRRSPRVVAIGRKPLRMTVGDFNSHTVIAPSISAMQQKNTATGVVQAIHSNIVESFRVTPLSMLERESIKRG